MSTTTLPMTFTPRRPSKRRSPATALLTLACLAVACGGPRDDGDPPAEDIMDSESDEPQAPTELEEIMSAQPVGEAYIMTARGPAKLAYDTVNGLAISDGDMVLGRVSDLATRQSMIARDLAAGQEMWHNGAIHYAWDMDDSPGSACALSKKQFCAGEMIMHESPGGAWSEFKKHLTRETNLTLVNVSTCYYNEQCRADYLADGHYTLLRRPFSLNQDDNEVECDAQDNPQQVTDITFSGGVYGEWKIQVSKQDSDGNQVFWLTFATEFHLGETPAELAGWLKDAFDEVNQYNDIPVTTDADGATLTLSGTNWESFSVTVESPEEGDGFELDGRSSACKGAKGCKNSACPDDTVCVAVWPYDGEFTEFDQGFCQQTSGHSNIGPWRPKDADDEFDPESDETALGLPTSWFHGRSYSSFGHETMHAAGFIHEQQRPDWAKWVSIADESCVEGKHNFKDHPDTAIYGWAGPMDFASLMMYGSNNQCKPTDKCENQCLAAIEGKCPESICGSPNDVYNDNKKANDPALWYIKTKGWSEGQDDFGKGMSSQIDRGRLGLSYNDQDALRLYGGDEFTQTFVEGVCPWYPDNNDGIPKMKYKGIEEGDRFGAALALGQFGDEDHGLVIGMPGEAEDVLGVKAGAATVWEAAMNTEPLPAGKSDKNAHLPGFPTHSPDQFILPHSFTDPIYQPGHNDHFGAAVVAVDFNGDGIDEIAVGAPDAGVDGRGAVYVYRTSDSKVDHLPWKIIHSDLPIDPEIPGSFGAALAAGQFADCGNGLEELAVGIPDGEVLGSHGKVNVYRWTGGELKLVQKIQPTDIGDPAIPQRFGAALAAADFNGDGQDGLVIGAPSYSQNGGSLRDLGRVAFYEQTNACSVSLTFKKDDKGAIFDTRLGASIVAGDFLRGTTPDAAYDDVAVGAPGLSAGAVRTYRAQGGTISFFEEIRQDTHNLDTHDPGDEFGYSLALVEYRETGTLAARRAHLFIGAPGEETNGFKNGAVYDLLFNDLIVSHSATYFGGERKTSDCDAGLQWGCNTINTDDEMMSRRFGEAIAADDQVLAIGDPDYEYNFSLPSAGSARIYIRERDQEEPDGYHLMRWIAEQASWPKTPSMLLP